MSVLQKHPRLVAELDKHEHERISATAWRFHHGTDQYDAAKLHVMLHQVGYYPAGRDKDVPGAWDVHRFARRDRPLHQVGIHRKTDPINPEKHFTDIVLY